MARRALIGLAAAIVAIGAFAGGLAWLLDTPAPPAGASHVKRMYYALCATCHGIDGRGSWRARLFLVDPGDLTESGRRYSAPYLFDLIKHGGAPIGRPGMPGFGHQLSDEEIQALVAYVQRLGNEEPLAGPTPSALREPPAQ